jgi:hypothetical protein
MVNHHCSWKAWKGDWVLPAVAQKKTRAAVMALGVWRLAHGIVLTVAVWALEAAWGWLSSLVQVLKGMNGE